MRKKILLTVFGSLNICLCLAQTTTTLTFTGIKTNFAWQKLDSIIITDETKNWSEKLIYDDTILVLQSQNSINFFNTKENFRTCFPNPFQEKTTLEIESGNSPVSIELYTIDGIKTAQWKNRLSAGKQRFSISVKNSGTYLLKIQTDKETLSQKIICTVPGNQNKIHFLGTKSGSKSSAKLLSTNDFTPGDNMSYVGYAVQGTIPQTATIKQAQWNSETLPFIFPVIASRVCPEHATVTDIDGNTYPTVLIGTQCWMKENLRVTRYADSTELPLGCDTLHNHEIPFYYKYNGSDSLAQIYGILYSWTAAMRDKNDTSAIVQGICPDGWHLPSDDEWCEMTRTLAPQSNCDDPVSFFGTQEYLARQLSFPGHWLSDDFTFEGMPGYWSTSPLYFNTSDFSALPAGFYELGTYFALGAATFWWTSTAKDKQESYCRYLQCNNKGMCRISKETCRGYSVRCVMNE